MKIINSSSKKQEGLQEEKISMVVAVRPPAKLLLILSLLSFMFISSCSEIFEKDISDKKLILISPADSLETETFSVVFWWDHLQDASEYNLQIVSPNFYEPAIVVIDTFTTENRLEITLSPGDYEWRIRALNGGYATEYQYRILTILSTNDLTKQFVKLVSPSNNSYTNKEDALTFVWEPISIADTYRFAVEGYPSLTQDVETNTVEMTLPDDEERIYQWSVTAINEESLKKSDVFTVALDYTNPLSPLLSNLSDGDTVDLPFTINWQRRSSDVIRDSIFIYEDSTMNRLVEGYPLIEISASHTLEEQFITIERVYYLRLRSVDRAGNFSIYTPLILFRYKDEE